jgi:hypothetical protein
VGGVVSSFASTTGILAAILPIVAPILQDPTVSAIGVISAIAIASIVVDLSPFSTNGALLLANVQGVPERVFFQVAIDLCCTRRCFWTRCDLVCTRIPWDILATKHY